MIVLTNMNFAVELTNEKLKSSLEKFFSKETRFIEWENQGDGRQTSLSSIGKINDTTITDTQIILKEEGYELVYNYSIEVNIVNVDYEKKVQKTEDSQQDMYNLYIYEYLGRTVMLKIYVAIADALDVDVNAAYGYYIEQLKKDGTTTEETDTTTGIATMNSDTDVADMWGETNGVDATVKVNMKVYTDVLSQITKDSFSSVTNYAVILTDIPEDEEEEDWLKTWIDNYEKENNINQNEVENNTETNTNTNTNTNTQTEMPKTGIAYETVYFLLGVIALCFVIGYRVYRAK